MPAAPISANDAQRCAAMRRVRLLGTPAEERFDKITRLARRMFGVSMAIIDIVGDRMAWLKSVQGFDGLDVPRAHSYCHYTVLRDEICLITDARIDPRVSDNPFAASFVFYAGVPLRFEGQNVGVFCIADGQPRTLDDVELDSLRDLAALAEHEFESGALSEAQLRLASANVELEMKSRIDVLTRIWNRGAITEIAEREIEQGRSGGTSTGIALIDVDHFKRVNDRYGHPAGDQVLRVVSERLRAALRPTDAVGRFGGEEFLLVLPEVSRASLFGICERVRIALASEPVTMGAQAIDLTCSIGCSVSDCGAESIGALVGAADQALYQAKAAGRNQVRPAISAA
jgi:diguanylate cyclase (GGDEF)-like protein